MLITDYSSISFDFAYQRRPVLYYQFDAERFYQTRGMMLLDPTRELFGERVIRHQDVVASLHSFFAGDKKMQKKYRSRADSFFSFSDARNCERIYEAIQMKRREKGVLD